MHLSQHKAEASVLSLMMVTVASVIWRASQDEPLEMKPTQDRSRPRSPERMRR